MIFSLGKVLVDARGLPGPRLPMRVEAGELNHGKH